MRDRHKLSKNDMRLFSDYPQRLHFTQSSLNELLASLRRNVEFSTLNLACSDLGDHGLAMIADGLLANKKVRVVLLANSQITDDGLQMFINMLTKNDKIVYVDVAFNMITNPGLLRRLEYLLQLNRVYNGFHQHAGLPQLTFDDHIQEMPLNKLTM